MLAKELGENQLQGTQYSELPAFCCLMLVTALNALGHSYSCLEEPIHILPGFQHKHPMGRTLNLFQSYLGLTGDSSGTRHSLAKADGRIFDGMNKHPHHW